MNYRFDKLFAVLGVFALLVLVTLALGWTRHDFSSVNLRAQTLTAQDVTADTLALGGGTQVDGVWSGSATVASGATSKAITVTGARPGDLGVVQWSSGNTSGVAIKTVAVTTNTLTATFANPGTTSTLQYLVTGR